MKRSRHRWLGFSLFCVTLICLSADLPTTSAVRATKLIFSKTSTTTAAPEEEVTGPEDENQEAEITAEDAETNKTSKLSGIPQIDYIYDPNLPRELNGYNLSEYPFYETVPPPEKMDFKCDGLHDGFYASIPHKCQVYHHCLFGTRYDFLCANYTAFDQKTFICQFVSEVDCKNSANYFSRNEALYKAASTEPPPKPSTTTTTTTTTTTARPPRPGVRRRPPSRYDYYDDDYYYPARDDYDYEERGGRRSRPRRPGKRRPHDDYDDRYETRSRPRDEPEEDYEERRPYDRPRPNKRPYLDNRRPYDDEDRRPYKGGRRPSRPRDNEEDRYRPKDEEEDRPRGNKRGELRPRDKIRPRDEDEIKPRDETRMRDEIRPRDEIKSNRDDTRMRDEIRPRDEIKSKDDVISRDEKRPRDEIRSRDDIRSRDEIRPRDEIRSRDEIRPRDEIRSRDEIRPRDDIRSRDAIKSRDEMGPLKDEVPESEVKPRERTRDDRYQQNEGRRIFDRPYRNRDERPYLKTEKNIEGEERVQDEKKQAPTAPEGQPLVKPNGHGIFGKPRMPPKIKRPVPNSEKDKYEYVVITTTKAPPKNEDEYYDDYEEEDTRKPSPSAKTSTVQQRPKLEPVEKEKFKPLRPHYSTDDKAKRIKAKDQIEYDEEEYYDEPPVRSQKYTSQRSIDERPSKVKDDDYYYDEKHEKQKRNNEEDITTRVKDLKPNVKVVRRPFLPSRGGSPYLPRGLQPVAGRDLNSPPNTTPKPTTSTTTSTTTTTTTTSESPTTVAIKSTTTEKITTTIATEKPTTSTLPEEEYEYYDEDDIEYESKDKKEPTTTVEIKPSLNKESTTTDSSTSREVSTEDKAKNLATKVLRNFNDNYAAIKEQLASTLTPGDYLKPYLGSATKTAKLEPKPEISKGYTATGKPLKIPDIKQNLADSIENDYDVRLNEAVSPNIRIPSGFIVPEREFTFSRYRNNVHSEPQFAASEISHYQIRKRPQISGVSIRTPSSYYIQPQRIVYDDHVRPARHLLYRIGDIF